MLIVIAIQVIVYGCLKTLEKWLISDKNYR